MPLRQPDIDTDRMGVEVPAETDAIQQPVLTRRELLALAISAVCLPACDKIDRLLGRQGSNSSPTSQPPSVPAAPQVDSNRPEFLDEKDVKLTGLTLMMANNDQFDRYIFNAVTGNRSHAQTFQIQGGYQFEFEGGRQYTMPYHAFLFKPFDPRSNVNLPKRLGTEISRDQGLAIFFRQYTKYRANDPKDIEAIKTILITSYELSFGVKLNPQHIKIESDGNGRLKSIKYTDRLEASTTIATKTVQDEEDPERRNIAKTKEQRWNLVGQDGELFFPPTVMADQGIALPHSAMLKYPKVKYAKSFKSQGKTININISVSVDAVMKDQDKLEAQGRPQNFEIEPGVIVKNLGYYVLDNDPLAKELAEIITEGFSTKREKMQAILDFVHSNNYVPDAYGEAPRTPRVTLISKGGDCEDSTILVVALARAVGIDCVFAYFDGHAAPVCDIGEEGTAFTWGNGKYEWCETTGGNEAVTTVTNYQDPDTRQIVRTEKTSRAWDIGEQPPTNIGPIKFVSQIGSHQPTRFSGGR